MTKSNFPAITDPRGTAKDVLLAIQNIRARIEGVESIVKPVTSVGGGITIQPTVPSLQAAISALQITVAALAATVAGLSTSSTSSTTTQSFIAAASITAGHAVYESSAGYVQIADPTVLAQSYAVIGIALNTVSAGQSVNVVVAGGTASGLGTGFTAGLPVFAGAGGALTQSPVASHPALQVGIAVAAAQVLVTPDQQLVTWEVNGTTIGWRRQVDFVQGTGIILTAVDDPTNNRVVIVVSAGSSGGSGCYPH